MQKFSSGINQIVSKFQQNQLPQHNTQSTLFDNLSPSEKQAAILKLDELAAQQPGSSTKHPRRFRWKVFIMVFFGLSLVTCIVLGSVALAVDKDKDPDLVAKLKAANTNLDRLALLPNDEDWFFDFTKQDKYTFAPGGVINANAATFPATVGQGMTLAMLNLGPCSMLPPHLHPRATNYVVAISGTTRTYMINENGARTVTETLTPGQMTIFPQGSIHTMINEGCENAQLISALNSDDSGTTNLANAFFSLPANITGPIIGTGIDTATIQNIIPAIGTGSNYGPQDCIAACKAKGKLIKREW